MRLKQKNQAKSRKQIRKESRLAKKAKKHEFFSKKKERSQLAKIKPDENELFARSQRNSGLSSMAPAKTFKGAKSMKKPSTNLQDEFRKELFENDKKRKELDKQMQKERCKKLKEDNDAEDKEIRRLEKQLRLRKRSEKSINNFFAEDGLDYLLEVCDRKKLNDAVAAEKNFKDDDSDFGEDYAQVTGMNTKTKKSKLTVDSISDSDDGPEELPSRRGVSKINKMEETPNKIEKKTGSNQEDSMDDDADEPSNYDSDEGSEMDDDGFSCESEGIGSSDVDDDDVNKDCKSAFGLKEGSVSGIAPDHLGKGNKRKSDFEKSANDQKKVKVEAQKEEISENKRKGKIELGKIKKKKVQKVKKNAVSREDEVSSCDYVACPNDDANDLTDIKSKSRMNNEKPIEKSVIRVKNSKNIGESRQDEERKNKKKKGKSKTEKTANSTITVGEPKKKNSSEDDIANPFSDDEVSSLGSDSSLDDLSGNESGGKKKSKEFWEDIYGRTRDKEGNVVSAYQPPQLRKKKDEAVVDSEKTARLKKQLKGLLNRLAENNMVSISSQVEGLYMAHSRNEMNETLWSLLRESLIAETLTPERLVAEHAMLISILGANIGGEVSAYCLQRCVTEWHQMWEEGPIVEDKRTNNVLLLLSYLYHFKLFHCTLLYDILELLLAKVDEKEVELVLLVLRTVGFSLRKDDPARLKEFVLKVQILANGQEAASEGSRARFMLDTVMAIKNNNMNKIPNYNPEYGERIKKTLRACIRKGNYNAELKITLDDLLKADERGRWWVVGSAWTGELPGEKDNTALGKEDQPKKIEEGFSNKLLDLAKKQRMNTDTRRTIFCVIMSAEDYLDAFEKLLKLALKGPSEREIMNVLLHCLLHEKQYNPYYSHLARRFCICDRRFQVMLQFAVWDRIQDLQSLSATCVTNLAKFLGFLILEKSLAISVLKVVHFAELDKPAVRFIRQVLLGILLADSEEAMVSAFGRIAISKPLKLFREGLRLFLHHFVLRNSKAVAGIDRALLTTRVKLADSALSASDRGLSI